MKQKPNEQSAAPSKQLAPESRADRPQAEQPPKQDAAQLERKSHSGQSFFELLSPPTAVAKTDTTATVTIGTDASFQYNPF